MSHIDVGEDAELALMIPVRSVYEEFLCPICFVAIKDCHMTICGHNFCKGCILECLNRKHQCPCCNKEIIDTEKDGASKIYFERLITGKGKVTQGSEKTTGTQVSSGSLSPIEELFHKYTKKSLLAYEDYLRELRVKYEKAVEKTRSEYAQKMTEASNKIEKGLRISSDDEAIIKLKNECANKLRDLELAHEQQVKLLLESYENYIKGFNLTPTQLPVTVNLTIPTKKVLIEGVLITPNDTVKELREKLKERLIQAKNAMEGNFAPSNVFVLIRKFGGEEIALLNENQPLVQYKIDPGSEIQLRGDVKLASEKPAECFTANYSEGKTVDYFTCKTCNLNWICGSCTEHCHQGHQIAPYLQNHKPTWACCYCVKHKKCKIVNNKSKP